MNTEVHISLSYGSPRVSVSGDCWIVSSGLSSFGASVLFSIMAAPVHIIDRARGFHPGCLSSTYYL